MPVARLKQKARPVGIHIILATQYPSLTIFSDIIKANFPTRISFKVVSRLDSKTILDSNGAENLLGKGDMLIYNDGKLMLELCAYIDSPEINEITRFIEEQPGFPSPYMLPEFQCESETKESNRKINLDDKDSLFENVAGWIISKRIATTVGIQLRFAIGFLTCL